MFHERLVFHYLEIFTARPLLNLEPRSSKAALHSQRLCLLLEMPFERKKMEVMYYRVYDRIEMRLRPRFLQGENLSCMGYLSDVVGLSFMPRTEIMSFFALFYL